MSTESKPRSYKDLLVWQKSMVLVKQIYRLTRGFPPEERFGLIAQMRRAAVCWRSCKNVFFWTAAAPES
jgi:hypothetical protein